MPYKYNPITGQLDSVGSAPVWGGITGNLSDQTDLQGTFDSKSDNSLVVHNSGSESIAGEKTFTDAIHYEQNGYTLKVGLDGGGSNIVVREDSGLNPQIKLQSDAGHQFEALDGTPLATISPGFIGFWDNPVGGVGEPRDGVGNDAATKNYVDTQDALKVAKSGDTMTGDLTMDSTTPVIKTGTDKNISIMPDGIGNVGINTTTPNEKITVKGNFQLKDDDTATKAYRFRTSGSNLDWDFAGTQLFISGYANPDFTGTQRFFLHFNSSSADADAYGTWRWQPAAFGTTGFTIDPGSGTPAQIHGTAIRIDTAKTPASATATGTTGDICWDSNFMYVCVATNTWKRTAIATW